METWIRTDAVGWTNDMPRAQFQRRTLAIVEGGASTAAVVAWQDITRVGLEGIWLEVLAVALDHQHSRRERLTGNFRPCDPATSSGRRQMAAGSMLSTCSKHA